MPGEPPRVQPSKKVESHWDADGNWIGRHDPVRAAPAGSRWRGGVTSGVPAVLPGRGGDHGAGHARAGAAAPHGALGLVPLELCITWPSWSAVVHVGLPRRGGCRSLG
jgi:hypothetical protein